MKKLTLTLCLFLAFASISFAQALRGLDKSPLDIAYFPDRFANIKKPGDKAVAKVIYSRPALNNRDLATLAPNGKVWRTGANEAAEVKFYQDVELAGKKVKAGTYSLFTIPGEKNWTVILSNDLDVWGSFTYNDKNDVTRVSVPATTQEQAVENFTIQFGPVTGKSGVMKMAWGKTLVEVPIKY